MELRPRARARRSVHPAPAPRRRRASGGRRTRAAPAPHARRNLKDCFDRASFICPSRVGLVTQSNCNNAEYPRRTAGEGGRKRQAWTGWSFAAADRSKARSRCAGRRTRRCRRSPRRCSAPEPLELGNVPEVSDVATMLALMGEFGVAATRGPGKTLVLDARAARNAQAPYDMVRKMRAGILVLAPLLARFGAARVSLPGGCAIGARPIDLHLKALAALGADVEIEAGYINARAQGDRLQGGRIVLSSPSVGATETALMAATLARGETEILNAAREPEVCDLALCLAAMGATIEGAGTHRILVQGADALPPRAPRADHRPHRGRHLRDRRRDHRRPSRDPRRPSRASRLGRRGAGECRRKNLADRSRPDDRPHRSAAGGRPDHRALSRVSHRPAGAVHGADDDRGRRLGDPRDGVREPVHARAGARRGSAPTSRCRARPRWCAASSGCTAPR